MARKNSILAITFGLLSLIVCSQLSIPLKPIPITMQTVALMLLGLLLPRKIALIIVALYLALGASGLPIFANYNSGLKVLFGPSGGYLWGFLAAVMLISALKKQFYQNKFWQLVLNCSLATLLILICGTCWLAYFTDLPTAMRSGFYPFIIPGMLKVLFTAMLAKYLTITLGEVHAKK